jgi:DNA recombination protein RmuC
MTSIVIIISACVLAGLLIWIKLSLTRTLGKEQDATSFSLLNQNMEAVRNQLRESLEHSSNLVSNQVKNTTEFVTKSQEQIGNRLDNASRAVLEVQKKLTKLEQDNLKIYEVGKDIASLQEILRSPKLRGNIGELFLGDLLSQVLPPQHYEMQHYFQNGQAVDAVVKFGAGMVPIDSKFPLENFNRMIEEQDLEKQKVLRKQFAGEVKKHAKSIAEKYIRPEEGTFNFALMYIPAENVYYETIIKDERWGEDKSISNVILEMRIIPVSPNTLYAYLQSIVLGLKGLEIEKHAKEILNGLKSLKIECQKFREDFDLVGKHLRNSLGKFDESERHLDKFAEKLDILESSETPQIKEDVRG